MALVLSTIAAGTIVNIDTSEAVAINGVQLYIDWRDVPGINVILHNDTPVFPEKMVCLF